MDHVKAELAELSRQIEAEPPGQRKDYLCAAYQALAWATMPSKHAPPSQMMKPATEGDKVARAIAVHQAGA